MRSDTPKLVPRVTGPLATPSESLWSLKGLHVLIVDDHPHVRSMLREMLTSSGADEIESVKTGEEALEAMARQKPDIVLCDYNLGEGKDGQQVLEEAREHDLLPLTSIFVLVTAENTLSMVMGVVEHEPDAYLTKPFTRIELQTRLRRLQQKKARFRKIARAMERREYQRAIQLCDEGTAAGDRDRMDLLRIKGEALARAHDYPRAEAHYRAVLDERELPWAQLGLGQALIQQQRHEEAIQVLQRAIAIKPHFVAALDAMARAQLAQGEADKAEQTLQQAVALSPKNLRRQKALARAAVDNGHLEIAEQAYKAVLKEGRHSMFGSPADFGGLAEVYLEQGHSGEASKLLGRMRRQYEGADTAAELQMAVVDSQVNARTGNKEAAKTAMARAVALFEANPAALSREEAMNLAQSCFKLGDTQAGTSLLQHVVRANHEDEAMLDRARAMFADAGLKDHGEAVIEEERKAMIRLNNEAVDLAKAGQLKDSVALLLRASQAMPENIAINLNAAQSLLMLMREDGANWRLLRQAQDILQRIGPAAAANPRYRKLMDLAQSMEAAIV